MIILAVESSASAASAALLLDDKLIGESFLNNGLTHSVTLLPMINSLIESTKINIKDIDLFAISSGPGSFTGLRIGAATVKGLMNFESKCIGVSTLEAMAYCHLDFEGTICACMDARCSQVYNALFENTQNTVKRLCDDRALMIDELIEELKGVNKKILLVGDGALLCYNSIKETCPELLDRVILSSESRRFQRASGVCLLANELVKNGEKTVSENELVLNYLRLPQAERQLLKKENAK